MIRKLNESTATQKCPVMVGESGNRLRAFESSLPLYPQPYSMCGMQQNRQYRLHVAMHSSVTLI